MNFLKNIYKNPFVKRQSFVAILSPNVDCRRITNTGNKPKTRVDTAAASTAVKDDFTKIGNLQQSDIDQSVGNLDSTVITALAAAGAGGISGGGCKPSKGNQNQSKGGGGTKNAKSKGTGPCGGKQVMPSPDITMQIPLEIDLKTNVRLEEYEVGAGMRGH